MQTFTVRFRPTGPWRFGPDSGARDQVDPLLHSDALYSAVTNAMARLGQTEEWLSDTVRNEAGPAVRFSSLFPYQRDLLLAPPPRGFWPPSASTKIRYKAARFVPLSVIESLIQDQPIDEDRWQVDGESGCMIPANRQEGPFRIRVRSNAAVDRIDNGRVDPHATACLEFARDSGLWMMAIFADETARARWEKPLRGALRLLADSGIGGERSGGWGRSQEPEWEAAKGLLTAAQPETAESGWWLLSVFAPNEADTVDWSRGNYATLTRTGRFESASQWGGIKPASMMIAEGSVLVAGAEPRGSASNIAPEGFPHPVYRTGYSVAIAIPWKVPA